MALRRNKNLIPLSREHHLGLLFCWKIRQGVKKNVGDRRMRLFVEHFWDRILSKHFQKEENELLDQVKSELSQRANAQHHTIRSLARTIIYNENNAGSAYSHLADILEKHIRFEERELFPSLESTLQKYELEDIGMHLMAHLPPEDEIDYDDEFWLDG